MFINKDELLAKTNGGLQIIFDYYPQAQEAAQNSRKSFKIRSGEKTASSTLKQLSDGNWVVTDFGDDSKPRNAILICMEEEGVDFKTALNNLAARYGVDGASIEEAPKAEMDFRPATPEEKDGSHSFSIKDEMTTFELSVLGPKVKNEHCKSLSFYSLHSFTFIKDRKAITTKSTDKYPIFLLDRGSFQKVYQPLSPEKGYKFRYFGERPKDYINGLSELQHEYEKYKKSQDKGFDDGDSQEYDKIPEAILSSGERDSMCIKSFGFFPLWMNSETAKLSPTNIKDIMACVDILYVLPDLDITGKRVVTELCREYLDVRIIWLPESMTKFRDRRGKPRKDFRDYVELNPSTYKFKQLMSVAMPFRFWDMEAKEKGLKYFFNNEQAFHFLSCNGFYRLLDPNKKEGYTLVQIEGHIVKEIIPADCKNYLYGFLKEKFLPVVLRNMLHKTTQMSESSLSLLQETEVDFTDFTRDSQFMYFKNAIWEISKKGIAEHSPGAVPKYVWLDEVVDRRVKVLDSPFELKYDTDNQSMDIKINNTDSKFFQFLINTSRVHWRTELEDRADLLPTAEREKYIAQNRFNIAGMQLDINERFEQKQHLINKMFCIGYLLHRYKDPSKPWCVYAMDGQNKGVGESHGGSGKSITFSALKYFMKTVYLPGRDPKMTENSFIFERVTEHTDMILVDDADQYLNFSYFFAVITGVMNVNVKNNRSFELSYEKSPKMVITTNYALRNIDSSTERRILYTVFSDFYHTKGDGNDYRETRTVRDDIGKNLFLDYDDDEWNADINFFARCVQLYLTISKKFDPPMENVLLRNLRQEMGEGFKDWADGYFDVSTHNLDCDVRRSVAFSDFKSNSGSNNWTSQRYMKSLKAWVRYNDYELNPKDTCTTPDGRIIKAGSAGMTEEFIFIRSNTQPN